MGLWWVLAAFYVYFSFWHLSLACKLQLISLRFLFLDEEQLFKCTHRVGLVWRRVVCNFGTGLNETVGDVANNNFLLVICCTILLLILRQFFLQFIQNVRRNFHWRRLFSSLGFQYWVVRKCIGSSRMGTTDRWLVKLHVMEPKAYFSNEFTVYKLYIISDFVIIDSLKHSLFSDWLPSSASFSNQLCNFSTLYNAVDGLYG